MAKGFVWNTGRYGYGGRLGGSGGGIDPNRVKRDHEKEGVVSPSLVFAGEFKRCIMLRDWDGAFTILFDAAEAGVISKDYRDKTARKCIPCLSDC